MKLNLEKCTFRITSNKFLGFMVSHWGIKVNLEKIQVVKSKWELRRWWKEVQRLTRRMPCSTNSFLDRLSNVFPSSRHWKSQKTSYGPINARSNSRGSKPTSVLLHTLASLKQVRSYTYTSSASLIHHIHAGLGEKSSPKAGLFINRVLSNVKDQYP